MIDKICIKNFKCFEGTFTLKMKSGVNIIVGDNEQGKSTILEALHLVLTGFFRGKPIRNNLNQFLFNQECVNEYIEKLELGVPIALPEILIEVYFKADSFPETKGDDFTLDNAITSAEGIYMKVALSDLYKEEYDILTKKIYENGEKMHGLPVEYYDITWSSFSRKNLTGRSVPMKSALIDVGFSKFSNGSDMYVSKIIQEILAPEEIVALSQAFRKTQEKFSQDDLMIGINEKLGGFDTYSDKKISLTMDTGLKSSWQGNLMTQLDSTPFEYIGKGEQALVKTQLALSSKSAEKAALLLIEEPESHVSPTRLNRLLKVINDSNQEKQILLTTHSSFVSNKLGLENLVLLENKRTTTFSDLSRDTEFFFKKVAGYDTLRMILCVKAILVEGDSDELVVQKAYMDVYGRLPIEDKIEVISVGTSFLRFLEIANKLESKVTVLTDNDGNVSALENKYSDYLGANSRDNIKICYEHEQLSGTLKINGRDYNYNTLEPLIINANGLETMNQVLGTSFLEEDDLRKYMKKNKTECALRIFESEEEISYPKYIIEGIS